MKEIIEEYLSILIIVTIGCAVIGGMSWIFSHVLSVL